MRLHSSLTFAVAATSISRNKEIGYLAGNSNHRAHSPNPALTVSGNFVDMLVLQTRASMDIAARLQPAP